MPLGRPPKPARTMARVGGNVRPKIDLPPDVLARVEAYQGRHNLASRAVLLGALVLAGIEAAERREKIDRAEQDRG